VLEVTNGILKEELSVAALLSVARPCLEDVAHEGIVSEGSVSLLACVAARRFVLPGVITVVITTGDVRKVSDAVGLAGYETYFCCYHVRPYTGSPADVCSEICRVNM
jgi:hypothetical protein